jgi:hypothetical protein
MFHVVRLETILKEAVDETVKLVTANAYPAKLIVDNANNALGRQITENNIFQFIPEDVLVFLEQILLSNKTKETNGVMNDIWENTNVHERWIVPIIMLTVDKNMSNKPLLNKQRLNVVGVRLPTFNNENESYFGLVVEYRLPSPVPFLRKEVVLKVASMERCWVGEMGGGN